MKYKIKFTNDFINEKLRYKRLILELFRKNDIVIIIDKIMIHEFLLSLGNK